MNKVFCFILLLAVCYGQGPQPCPENPIVLTGNSFPQFVYSPYDERNNYPSNTDCRFVLLARNAQRRLHLTIIESELEEPLFTDCKDYVSVRDGNQPTSQEIARWCGKKYPSSLTSANEALYIHFHSDNVIQRRGFNLSFVDFELPGCPPGWISFNTQCYKLFLLPHGATWVDSQKECTFERSNLLTFSHINEYTFIYEKFANAHTFPWIGYNDADDESHFKSVDPTELIWPENFPIFTADHEGKDCVYLDFNLKDEVIYGLDDCRHKHSFICKKENDGSTVPVAPPTSLIHHGLEDAGMNQTTWLIILVLILVLIIILILCYLQYKKRTNNRVANVDQNHRLVTGAATSTSVVNKTHTNSKATSNTNQHSTTRSGSASKSKGHHTNQRALRQTSVENPKNQTPTERKLSEGNVLTNTDSPRFNMAANQPGAITMFNTQHVDHLVQEQRQHELDKTKPITKSTIVEMPGEDQSENVVETLIEEENGNIEVENIIRNHVVVSDDDSTYKDETPQKNNGERPGGKVSIVNDEVIENALHPSTVPESEITAAETQSSNNTATNNTGIKTNSEGKTEEPVITKENKTAMTDPASASIQSEDFDGIQMSPMNPHTQKKRRSHIHILSNVQAKTPEEFWEH